MLKTLQKISLISLFASILLALYCIGQMFIFNNIYPYALLGLMALITFATFLSINLMKDKYPETYEMIIILIGVLNTVILVSSAFYPSLLKNMWNITLGVAFSFPTLFFLSKVKGANTKLEKTLFYLIILNFLLVEAGMIFMISKSWYYDILTASMFVFSIVLVTNLIFYFVNKKEA